MLQKILVPLDGSELADRMLTRVRGLLQHEDAEVTLLHVLRRLPPAEVRGAGDLTAEQAKLHLGRLQRSLQDGGARVRIAFMSGDPAQEIVNFAEALRPSLIAMSTHGRTGLTRVLRGSVAEEVLRHSPFPVLLCNPHASDTGLRVRRVLVPTDGSEASAGAVPVVEDFSRWGEVEVVVFHVAAVYPDPLGYPVTTMLPTSEDAARVVEPFARRFDPNRVRVRTQVAFGLPESAIVQAALAEQVDLVVMTSHRRTGFARLLLGSVTEAVLRASPCPVVVVGVATDAATAPATLQRASREV